MQGLPIYPLSFAPDPSCYSMSFADSCEYVVHTNYHNEFQVGRRYKGAKIRDHDTRMRSQSTLQHLMGANARIDEMWIMPELAGYCGIKTKEHTYMVTVWLVDDEPFQAVSNLLWYPSFPFAGGGASRGSRWTRSRGSGETVTLRRWRASRSSTIIYSVSFLTSLRIYRSGASSRRRGH